MTLKHLTLTAVRWLGLFVLAAVAPTAGCEGMTLVLRMVLS